jgi:hypothetical protein
MSVYMSALFYGEIATSEVGRLEFCRDSDVFCSLSASSSEARLNLSSSEDKGESQVRVKPVLCLGDWGVCAEMSVMLLL